MKVLAIPQTHTYVFFVCDYILFPLLLGLFSDKLGFWMSQDIQYFLACHCTGINWGWSSHGLLPVMPSKLGNALPLFIDVIVQESQVVSAHFRSFT